jgi:hypothetical protein
MNFRRLAREASGMTKYMFSPDPFLDEDKTALAHRAWMREHNLYYLGRGAYSVVFGMPDGNVFKVCTNMDGTGDYLEWCHLRLKKFGANSTQMRGLAQVLQFGRYVTKLGTLSYWAIMPKYTCAKGMVDCMSAAEGAVRDTIDFVDKTLTKGTEGYFCNDVHPGNIMWDEARQGFVLTDPSCHDSNRGRSGKWMQSMPGAVQVPVPPTIRKVAHWKRNPFNNLHHMRAH